MKSLLTNWKLKLLSGVLAVLTWYVVNQITDNNKTLTNLPVQFLLPDGWAIRDQDPASFTAVFSGTREDLLRLDGGSISLTVDLRAAEFAPERVIRLTHKNLLYPGNARLYQLTPDQVTVRFGREGTKMLHVRANPVGDLPMGYRVESIEVEPVRVKVFGAVDRLEPLVGLQTAPLDLSGRIQSFSQEVDILSPGGGWTGRFEPSRVTVRVVLAGITEDRELSNVPVRILGGGDPRTEALELRPPTVSVLVRGRPELLASLSDETMQVFALESGGAERSRRVSVHVPTGVEIVDVRPRTVQLVPRPVPTPTPTPVPVPTATATPDPTPSPDGTLEGVAP